MLPENDPRTILIVGATVNSNSTIDTRFFISSISNFKITDAISNNVLRNFVPAKMIKGANVDEVGYFDIIKDGNYMYKGDRFFSGKWNYLETIKLDLKIITF